jgi:hypothetical protein
MNNAHIVLNILAFVHTGGTNYHIKVQAPRDVYVAQPRYYMLFVVDQGTPSKGQWIRLVGQNDYSAYWPGF